MRGLLSVLALATLAFTAPSPYTTTNTPASVSASLAHDSLTIHVLRADDLLSDETPEHERSLIAERLTHVVLKIKFDEEESALSVNDEKLDLSGLIGDGADEPSQRVQVVKAEALMLGEDNEIDGRAVSPDELAEFAEQTLPRGLVSTEVSIVEDATDALNDVEEDSSLTVKSYSVFVKITEIDSLELTHSTTVLVPVLKLELTLRNDESGRPVSFTAFQIGPRPHGSLPAVSIEEPEEDFEDGYLDELTYREEKEDKNPEKGHVRPPFPGPPPHKGEEGNGMDEYPHPHPHPPPPPGPPRRGPPGPPRRGPPGPPRRGPPGPPRGAPPPPFEHERPFPPPPPFGKRPPPPPFEHGPEHEHNRFPRPPPPPFDHHREHEHEHHREHEHEHEFPPPPPHRRPHGDEEYEHSFPPREREREYERRPHHHHEEEEAEDRRGPWRLEHFKEDNEDEFPHHPHRHHHEEEEVDFEDELAEDESPRSPGRRPHGHHHSLHHPHGKFHHRHAHRPSFLHRLVRLAHSPAFVLAWTGVELILFGVVVKMLVGKWRARRTGTVRLADESEVDVADKA
ncbi:hypothetical protein JCM1840_001964 [Sporobolomyces johnsonii]